MTRWKKPYFDFALPRAWTVPKRVVVVGVAVVGIVAVVAVVVVVV